MRTCGIRHELERLGWSVGRNVGIDYRFAANNPDQYQPLAKDLVRLTRCVVRNYDTDRPSISAGDRNGKTPFSAEGAWVI
jgi:hypothetical protein